MMFGKPSNEPKPETEFPSLAAEPEPAESAVLSAPAPLPRVPVPPLQRVSLQPEASTPD